MSDRQQAAGPRTGPLGLSDDQWGKTIAGMLAAVTAVALLPGLVLGAAGLVATRASGVRGRFLVAAAPLALVPALLVGLEPALSAYGEAGPPWQLAEALERRGALGWLGAVAPVALPVAAAVVAAGFVVDALRRGPADELRRRQAQERRRHRRTLARARTRAGAPKPQEDDRGGRLGIYLGGDRDCLPLERAGLRGRDRWALMLLRYIEKHVLVLGSSGSGKTYTLLTLCKIVALICDWQIIYIDAKRGSAAARLFPALMRSTPLPDGRQRSCRVFPDEPFDGWRGDGRELANRLLRSLALGTTEGAAYYGDTTRQAVELACLAPQGPPRDSLAFRRRLHRGRLIAAYGDEPLRKEAAEALEEEEVKGTFRRYDALFGVGGELDGKWAWEDADSAYLLVDSQRYGDEAPRILNYLLEHLVQYVASGRKDKARHVLIVVDEFSAGARGSAAAIELVERLRELRGHAVLAPQVAAGLGDEQAAERILGSTHVKILHQMPDPEPIIRLAGTTTGIEASVQTRDEQATGLSSAREQYQFKVPPQQVREAEPGEGWVLRQGLACHLQVAWPKVEEGEAAVGGERSPHSAPAQADPGAEDEGVEL